jgi:hypothetical protein
MDRPIIFSGAMVRAIMADLKTQTRRLDGLAVVNRKPSAWQYGGFGGYVSELNGQYEERFDNTETGDTLWVKCPYWPRQVRWVRETWCPTFATDDDSINGYCYRATNNGPEPSKWRPAIFMPRRASRITLEVVSVRVERVQSISEADAMAEGVDMHGIGTSPQYDHTAVGRFETLWNAINAPRGYGWAVNPWVRVVQFRKCGEG